MSLPAYRVEFMPGAGPFDIPGDFYLDLTGASTSRAHTPDVAALDIVGDIDLRFEATLDDWAPPTSRAFGGKWVVSGNQKSYLMWLDTTGRLVFAWTTDGSTSLIRTSTASVTSVVPGAGRRAVRATLDVDNGASQHVVTFYTAPSIGGSWTPLGSTIMTAGTTSIFSGTALFEVGSWNNGGGTSSPDELVGRVHKVEVRNGIAGSVAANPDFTAQVAGTTSFTDGAGRSWTVQSPASIVGFNWEQIPDDRVKEIEVRDGRDNELDVFPPSTARVVLRSNDRRYDPQHTTGPHFGKLLPRVPVRIRISPDGGVSWKDWYYGFVQGGWAQSYRKPSVGTCTIELEDLLGVIEHEPLPQTAYDAEVLRSNPRAFWQLNEAEGIQMADSSGNGFHGRIDNSERVDGLVFGSPKALFTAHVGDHRGIFKGQGLPITAPMSIETWIKTPRDLTAFKNIVRIQRDNSQAPFVTLGIATSSGSPNGELFISFGGIYVARGSTRVDDDEVHHVVATVATLTGSDVLLYVDGVLETKTTITGSSFGPWTSLLWWTVGNAADVTGGDFGLDGTSDEVAIYDRPLTSTEVTGHYAAGTTAFEGEFSGARVNRVLDLLNVPSSLRDIATGDSTVGPASYGGANAGAYLQRVTESEQGTLYIDHRAGGKLRFRGRYDRLTATRSKASQTTFTPKHFTEAVAPDPNGVESIVNVVDVSWRGGTETVMDEASRRAFGPRSRSIDTEAPTPEAARSAGNWMIARYKDPQSRLKSLPVNLAGKPALWSTVMDLRISDRITVERHPQGVGAKITEQLIIERIALRLNEDRSWGVEFRLSDADDSQVWVWDTAQWDLTTVWG